MGVYVFVSLFVATYIAPIPGSFLYKDTLGNIFERHCMVFSNVPGYSVKDKKTNDYSSLYMWGQEVLGTYSFFYNVLPQIIMVSYRDKIQGTLCISKELYPDHDYFKRCFFAELRELATEAFRDRDGVKLPAEQERAI